ncbi:C6 transcription factor [Purpureocillium lavendulum]|uniref:C6 transcription factor n=1 Tax=Purpureocillium lavendulum TaxID=1247861 RepID=A0AB34FMQ7_9HYPO|nr:C6 transcription factor [Purpureocillium lavendulum]
MASAAEPPGVPHMPLHRPKRLKIDVACDTCRARKVKCDGARPACGNCSKRFVQRDKCRYSSNDRKPASTGGDNPRLLASHVLLAAREPEPPSSAFVATPFSAAPTVHVLPPVVASLRPRSASGSGGERPLAPHVVTSSEVPQEEQPDTSPSVIDSMTAVVDDGVSTEEYFGSSSAGSFTAQIKAAIGIRLGKTKPTSSPSTSNPGLANITAARRKGMLSTAHDVLPPRRQADHLMNVYWHYIHSLYPFLDRRKWERSYSALFAGTPLDTDERIFVATLDIIFALATQLVESLSTQSIIGLILEHQTSGGPTAISLLPAWWYRVYYIFSAATVLIAAKLRPDLFPSENVLKAWNRAMGILKSLGQLAPSANRCVVALQILSSKIIQNPPEASTPAPAATPSQNVGPDGQPPEEAQDSPAEQKLQPFPDLDLADVTFDVDDFSWLDDMNAWGLVNE